MVSGIFSPLNLPGVKLIWQELRKLAWNADDRVITIFNVTHSFGYRPVDVGQATLQTLMYNGES